jgi:hypothetical protein
MGAASALHLQDPILAQYREQGLIMWRGFTLEQFANQVHLLPISMYNPSDSMPPTTASYMRAVLLSIVFSASPTMVTWVRGDKCPYTMDPEHCPITQYPALWGPSCLKQQVLRIV